MKRDRGLELGTTEKQISPLIGLWLRLCFCRRQGCFYDKIRIIVFALVIASQVKTRLNNRKETLHASVERSSFLVLGTKLHCYY